jgi:hypothetical protein
MPEKALFPRNKAAARKYTCMQYPLSLTGESGKTYNKKHEPGSDASGIRAGKGTQ